MGLAVLHATARFHHPAHAGKWSEPGLDEQLEAVYHLILVGIDAR